jgi:hypothetical protein
MAYTSAPEKDTYGTQRITSVYPIDMRVGVSPGNCTTRVDAGMVNLLPRKIKEQKDSDPILHAESRLPICAGQVAATSDPVRGCYVWEKSAGNVYYFVVINTSVYTSTTGLAGSWTAVNTLLTSASSPVGFTEFINASNVKSLVLVDGVEGYVYTSNAAGTKITDVDFPTPHVPNPIFLDGYLFLAKANTADLYNSDLNDPAAWTNGSYISSELYPDDITGLVKINNYLVAIGRTGTEFFYDAANASGSPLARYDGGVLPFGTSISTSLASTENMAIFIANNNDGEAVIKVIEDFKHKEIDAAWMMPYLNLALNNGASAANIRGYMMRQNGDLLYVLRIPGASNTNDAGNGVFAYSFDAQQWFEFSCGSDGQMFNVMATHNGTSGNIATFVAGNYFTGGVAYFGSMGPSTLSTSYFTSYGQDYFNGGTTTLPYQIEIRTVPMDFGTMNLKFMSRFAVGQTVNNTSATPSMTLYWSDGDYTFNNSSPLNAAYDFPFVTQLGSFRRRAFKLVANAAYSFRIKFFEVDINKGQQ